MGVERPDDSGIDRRERVVAFGPFLFDRQQGRLSRGDVLLHLPPRATALLAELLAHRGSRSRRTTCSPPSGTARRSATRP